MSTKSRIFKTSKHKFLNAIGLQPASPNISRVILFMWVFVLPILACGCNSSNTPQNTPPATPQPAATESPEVKQSTEIKTNTAYSVVLPVSKVTSPNNKGTFTYHLLRALLEPINSEQKKITFTIKAMFEGSWQGAFWEENFVVILDNGDVVNANNPTKDMVLPNRNVEKGISFTIPKSETNIDLLIKGRGNKFSSIPIDLTKVAP